MLRPGNESAPDRSGSPAAAESEGLGFDPVRAVEHLRDCDPVLRRVIGQVGSFRLELRTAPTAFATLAEAIVYQQLNSRAAATIFARVRSLALDETSGLDAETILARSDEELRTAGLSRPKLLALRDLAARTVSGELPTLAQARGMDDDAIIDRLTRVRGIGRWTAEMFLIFRLGRPDVLPSGDYALRRMVRLAYGMPEMPGPDEVERRGGQWRPYRTVASCYLWGLAENPGIKPA